MNIVDIYMNNLRKDDVLNFATKKDIRLSNEELDFTYDFIKILMIIKIVFLKKTPVK